MIALFLACSAKDPAGDSSGTEPPPFGTALGIGEGELDPASAQWSIIIDSGDGATDPRDIAP